MDVIVRKRPNGIMDIILDRPKALNALTPFMVSTLEEALLEGEGDDAVKMVVISSNCNRAFCAGGDVKGFYEAGIENHKISHLFASQEYELARKVFHFPKRIVTVVDGILMGGGAALAFPASHLIGTERTRFAMPEVNIGYFPDVGSAFYLSRLPKRVGWFLAMTGATIGAADLNACGLIQHFVASDKVPAMLEGLPQDIDKYDIDVGPPTLDFDMIEEVFSLEDFDKIIETFGPEHFAMKSPASVRIAFEQMRVASRMGFDQVIDLDIEISRMLLQERDVYEGVRAKLVTKDNQPKWVEVKDLDDKIDRLFGSL